MEIIKDVDQGDPEWFSLRIGSLGGSSIGKATAGGQGKVRNQLLYQMAGEILSGEKYEGYRNHHMDRGLELEAAARDLYAFLTGADVEQVAMFKYSDHEHFSPDGVVGDDGIIEIKSVIPSVHVETILSDKVPAAYRKQVQWGLKKREWCDFVSYCPSIKEKPIWIKTVGRDAKVIKELEDGAAKFIEEMLLIVERIKS
jgi:hypothetical protein